MAKWMFAPLMLMSFGAQANGLAQHTSGCVLLDETIYEEITASGWGMTGADLVSTNFREPSVVVCTGTLSGRATPKTGNGVTWQADVGLPGANTRETGKVGDRSGKFR